MLTCCRVERGATTAEVVLERGSRRRGRTGKEHLLVQGNKVAITIMPLGLWADLLKCVDLKTVFSLSPAALLYGLGSLTTFIKFKTRMSCQDIIFPFLSDVQVKCFGIAFLLCDPRKQDIHGSAVCLAIFSDAINERRGRE